jgi:hypothetical protein
MEGEKKKEPPYFHSAGVSIQGPKRSLQGEHGERGRASIPGESDGSLNQGFEERVEAAGELGLGFQAGKSMQMRDQISIICLCAKFIAHHHHHHIQKQAP